MTATEWINDHRVGIGVALITIIIVVGIFMLTKSSKKLPANTEVNITPPAPPAPPTSPASA